MEFSLTITQEIWDKARANANELLGELPFSQVKPTRKQVNDYCRSCVIAEAAKEQFPGQDIYVAPALKIDGHYYASQNRDKRDLVTNTFDAGIEPDFLPIVLDFKKSNYSI